MTEPTSSTAGQGLTPEQAVVKRALQDAQQSGDPVAVAVWLAEAERVNLPLSVRGIAPAS